MRDHVTFFNILADELEATVLTESFTDPRGGMANRLAFAEHSLENLPPSLVPPARSLMMEAQRILRKASGGGDALSNIQLEATAAAQSWRKAVEGQHSVPH